MYVYYVQLTIRIRGW